jgi:N-acetylneuraminic acid mutarotase
MFNGDIPNLGHFLVYTYTALSPGGGTFEVAAGHDPVVGRKSADLQDWMKIDDTHVLVTGGISAANITANAANIAVVFNASTDAVSASTVAATNAMVTPRVGGVCVKLQDNRVLIIGGKDSTNALLASCEVYTLGTNTWLSTGSLATARSGFGYALLADGRVAVFGGTDASTPTAVVLDSIEIYDPASGLWNSAGRMIHARTALRAIALAGTSGTILICGGKDADGFAVAEAELFTP